MLIAKRSPMSGKINQLQWPISQEQYEAWRGGELIQRVMLHLSPEQREFLISGYTPKEQNSLFSVDDQLPSRRCETGPKKRALGGRRQKP